MYHNARRNSTSWQKRPSGFRATPLNTLTLIFKVKKATAAAFLNDIICVLCFHIFDLPQCKTSYTQIGTKFDIRRILYGRQPSIPV